MAKQPDQTRLDALERQVTYLTSLIRKGGPLRGIFPAKRNDSDDDDDNPKLWQEQTLDKGKWADFTDGRKCDDDSDPSIIDPKLDSGDIEWLYEMMDVDDSGNKTRRYVPMVQSPMSLISITGNVIASQAGGVYQGQVLTGKASDDLTKVIGLPTFADPMAVADPTKQDCIVVNWAEFSSGINSAVPTSRVWYAPAGVQGNHYVLGMRVGTVPDDLVGTFAAYKGFPVYYCYMTPGWPCMVRIGTKYNGWADKTNWGVYTGDILNGYGIWDTASVYNSRNGLGTESVNNGTMIVNLHEVRTLQSSSLTIATYLKGLTFTDVNLDTFIGVRVGHCPKSLTSTGVEALNVVYIDVPPPANKVDDVSGGATLSDLITSYNDLLFKLRNTGILSDHSL